MTITIDDKRTVSLDEPIPETYTVCVPKLAAEHIQPDAPEKNKGRYGTVCKFTPHQLAIIWGAVESKLQQLADPTGLFTDDALRASLERTVDRFQAATGCDDARHLRADQVGDDRWRVIHVRHSPTPESDWLQSSPTYDEVLLFAFAWSWVVTAGDGFEYKLVNTTGTDQGSLDMIAALDARGWRARIVR